MEITSKETQLAHALRSAFPRQAAAATLQQPSAAPQVANAAANRERIAAAAAVKKEAEDNWVPPEEWVKMTKAEQQAKNTAWLEATKLAAARLAAAAKSPGK